VFFPLSPESTGTREFPSLSDYAEVVSRYWIFLPAAFLAERGAFAPRSPIPVDVAVTPLVIKRRKHAFANSGMMLPYKNVIRMHLLIFFFAAAHFARLENFAVYAVVYAVYFFPWHALKQREARKTLANENA
jgi:hypothetical protein